MISAFLVSLLLTADPCTDAPPLPPDPVAAQAYREIGEQDAKDGEPQLAAIAYREALRRAPDDAATRNALEAICHPPPTAFERGQALFDRGDNEGAIPLLDEARKETHDPSAALLEGIALYQVGREREARPVLEEAAADPSVRGSARFFLGLIALHEGDGAVARASFSEASADPSLAADARSLEGLAATEGKLKLSLLAGSLWDSNPTLLPAAAIQAGASDVAFTFAGLLLAQPFGPSGPYARLAGAGNVELKYDVYDFAGGTGTLGWRLGADGTFALAEYSFGDDALDGAPYLVSHTLRARAQWAPGAWLLGGGYAAANRSFQTDAAAPYSGWLQRAHGYLGYRIGSRAQLFGGYRLTRDAVQEADFSYLEHAPWVEVRLFLGQRVRLVGEGDFGVRTFDATDAVVGIVRRDHVLEGTATAEYDLTPRLQLRLSVGGEHQDSNIADYTYDAGSVSLGLQFSTGLL